MSTHTHPRNSYPRPGLLSYLPARPRSKADEPLFFMIGIIRIVHVGRIVDYRTYG